MKNWSFILKLHFWHPCLSDPMRIILFSGDKLKEPKCQWGQKISGEILISIVYSSKISVEDSQFFHSFHSSKCSFPMGIKFQGNFLTGKERILSLGRGSHRVCDIQSCFFGVRRYFELSWFITLRNIFPTVVFFIKVETFVIKEWQEKHRLINVHLKRMEYL